MTAKELGSALKKMYDNAHDKEKATMVHLFGIRYAEKIQENNISCKEIVSEAKIKESYKTEIRKGVNLAKHVKEK